MNKYFAILLLTILLSACAAPQQASVPKDSYLHKYSNIEVFDQVELKGKEEELKAALEKPDPYAMYAGLPVSDMPEDLKNAIAGVGGFPKNWYEAMRVIDKSGPELPPEDRHRLSSAFHNFIQAAGHNNMELYGESFSEFQALAEYGSSWSQYMLGMYYLGGLGSTLQDFTLAHMWLNVAASQGHRKAAAVLDVLTKDMSAEQIAEAQKLARECVAREYKGC